MVERSNDQIRELLRGHAGRRSRTVDEHMFAVGDSTFRLQMFSAPGLRPVAVATQTLHEGTSLVNGAEKFVGAVWRQHCPDEEQPPIFIARLLLEYDDSHFKLHRFVSTRPYSVRSPLWGPRLREAEMSALVGGPVDPTRGAGYIERERPSRYDWRFTVVALADLPRPRLHGEPPCMPSTAVPAGSPAPRLLKQPGCCWYHAGDWTDASEAAIDALTRATSMPPATDAGEAQRMVDILEQVGSQRALDDWAGAAAASLFLDPIVPSETNDWGFSNGRHRIQAMLDARVRRTVIGYFRKVDGYR